MVLNEFNYIEDCVKNIENGDYLDLKVSVTDFIRLLSIYLDNDLDKVLEILNKSNLPNYNEVKWYERVKKLVNNNIKYNSKMIDVDFVSFYESEYNYIKTCENIKDRKILFTAFILCKYLNEYSEKYNNYKIGAYYTKKKLFDIANVNFSKEDRYKSLNRLHSMQLILMNNVTNNISIWLPKLEEDKELLRVSNFENLGRQLCAFEKSKTHKQCLICGKLIKVTSNKIKYCDKCAKEEEAKNATVRKKNQRERAKCHEIEPPH